MNTVLKVIDSGVWILGTIASAALIGATLAIQFNQDGAFERAEIALCVSAALAFALLTFRAGLQHLRS